MVNLILKSNNKTLIISDDTPYKLVNLDGIERSELELNIVNNAQFDGSIVVSKRIQNRPISITVDYKGLNKEIERQKLISFFNPKNKGVLIINYGELERSIEYEIEDFNSKLINIHDDLSFTVDLICPNPFFSDIHENKTEIALWVGDFEFQLEIPLDGIELSHREPSLIVNVFNPGNVESGMRIEFKAIGTLKNPSLFNVNTREFIKLNRTMVAGEVISINTNKGKKRIESTINGITTNISNYIDLDSDYIQLEIGDNLFRYDADENIDNLEVSIYYSPQYLGV